MNDTDTQEVIDLLTKSKKAIMTKLPEYYKAVPRKVKIGSRVWTIEFVKEFAATADGMDLAGFTDIFFGSDRILIIDNLSEGLLREVVWHELMHAMWACGDGGNKKNKKDLEHYFIGIWDARTVSILRDNPKLVSYLTK